MPTYKIQEGDCCSSLAARHNLSDCQKIYDAQTPEFKRKHPNPNQLTPGDLCSIPKPCAAEKPKPVGNSHNFVVAKATSSLRLRLQNEKGEPLKVVSAKLKQKGIIKDITLRLVEGAWEHQNISCDLNSADLEVEMNSPLIPLAPFLEAPPEYTGRKMPYPPTIVEGQFHDAEPIDYVGDCPQFVTWTLKIGSLPPHTSEAGVQARLQNLGFSMQNGLPEAAQAFQDCQNSQDRQNNASGLRNAGNEIWKQIREKVCAVHDGTSGDKNA